MSLEESLKWTKEHYPNLQINEVSEELKVLTEEDNVHITEIMINIVKSRLKKAIEREDWIMAKNCIEQIVLLKYHYVEREK